MLKMNTFSSASTSITEPQHSEISLSVQKKKVSPHDLQTQKFPCNFTDFLLNIAYTLGEEKELFIKPLPLQMQINIIHDKQLTK
jgi:hypothetical protein